MSLLWRRQSGTCNVKLLILINLLVVVAARYASRFAEGAATATATGTTTATTTTTDQRDVRRTAGSLAKRTWTTLGGSNVALAEQTSGRGVGARPPPPLVSPNEVEREARLVVGEPEEADEQEGATSLQLMLAKLVPLLWGDGRGGANDDHDDYHHQENNNHHDGGGHRQAEAAKEFNESTRRRQPNGGPHVAAERHRAPFNESAWPPKTSGEQRRQPSGASLDAKPIKRLDRNDRPPLWAPYESWSAQMSSASDQAGVAAAISAPLARHQPNGDMQAVPASAGAQGGSPGDGRRSNGQANPIRQLISVQSNGLFYPSDEHRATSSWPVVAAAAAPDSSFALTTPAWPVQTAASQTPGFYYTVEPGGPQVVGANHNYNANYISNVPSNFARPQAAAFHQAQPVANYSPSAAGSHVSSPTTSGAPNTPGALSTLLTFLVNNKTNLANLLELLPLLRKSLAIYMPKLLPFNSNPGTTTTTTLGQEPGSLSSLSFPSSSSSPKGPLAASTGANEARPQVAAIPEKAPTASTLNKTVDRRNSQTHQVKPGQSVASPTRPASSSLPAGLIDEVRASKWATLLMELIAKQMNINNNNEQLHYEVSTSAPVAASTSPLSALLKGYLAGLASSGNNKTNNNNSNNINKDSIFRLANYVTSEALQREPSLLQSIVRRAALAGLSKAQ